MEPIRYRPGEAIRWLQTGAESIRKQAREMGREAFRPDADRSDAAKVGKNVKDAAGALFNLGKSAWTDMLHRQADASEYVLQSEHFDVVKGGSIQSVEYDRVRKIEQKGDKYTFILDKGHVSIKPYAHLVSGKVKVPIGWTRNGMEVPFELLIEELSARCGVNLESR